MPFAFDIPYGSNAYDAKYLSSYNWIVHSDRDSNKTYCEANFGSATKANLKFLDKFYVTGVKGDFLHIYKYDTKKLLNSPKGSKSFLSFDAEDMGWIEKSKVILWHTALYSNKNIVIKVLPVIQSGLAENIRTYTNKGMIMLYNDPYNRTPNKQQLTQFDFLYVYKHEVNNRLLLGKSVKINSDDPSQSVIGWVDSKIVMEWGGRIFIEPNWETYAVEERKKANIKTAIFKDSLSAAFYHQTGSENGNLWNNDPYENRLQNASRFPFLGIKNDIIETCFWGDLHNTDSVNSIFMQKQFYLNGFTSLECLKITKPLFKRVILLTADEYEFIGQQLRLISFVEGSDEEKRNRIKYAFKSIISLSGQKFMNYNEVTIRSALELITGIKSSNNLLDSITINDILDRQKLSDSDLAQLIEHIENKMILFKAARNNPSYMIKKNDDIIYWIPEDFFP
jgi:hypothetical protein